MNARRLRVGLASAAVATAMLSVPTPSYAIFHWFRNLCRRPVSAVPVVAASPCNPCATQTVQYVPQTSYRTQIVNVPVTTYQPVRSCGLCGPTTTLRPVTVMRPTTQVVPYTTYRPVTVTARPTVSLRPTVHLMPTTTTTLYAPTSSSGACCGGAAPTTSYSVPSTTTTPSYTTPSQTYTTPSPTPAPSSNGQETQQPSLRPQTPANGNGNGNDNGYQEGSGSRQSSHSLQPIPDQSGPAVQQPSNAQPNASGQNGAGPYFAPPASRTTDYNRGWTSTYSPVNWTARVEQPAASQPIAQAPPRPAIDDSGWAPVRP